jgi:hypothetical protein
MLTDQTFMVVFILYFRRSEQKSKRYYQLLIFRQPQTGAPPLFFPERIFNVVGLPNKLSKRGRMICILAGFFAIFRYRWFQPRRQLRQITCFAFISCSKHAVSEIKSADSTPGKPHFHITDKYNQPYHS